MSKQGKKAIVVGASQGLGRGVARAFAGAGMEVIAVARNEAKLQALEAEGEGRIQAIAADATDPIAAGRILQQHSPDVLVLVAGASPLLRPLHLHTWETFSQNWEVDVKASFHWLRDALLLPLKEGAEIVLFSSGAALHGSPLSGGYGGAKAMQWMMAKYVAAESKSLGLDFRVHALLPRLSPHTSLGMAAVEAYAQRAGAPVEEFQKRFGDGLTPSLAGRYILELLDDEDRRDQLRFSISGEGLKPLD